MWGRWTWGKKEWCCWGLPSSHLSQTLRKAVQSGATPGQSIRPCWGDSMVKLWQSLQLEVTPICSNWQLVPHSYLHEPGPALCWRCSIICWCNTSSGGPIFEEFSFVLVAQLFYFCLQCSLSWENNQRMAPLLKTIWDSFAILLRHHACWSINPEPKTQVIAFSWTVFYALWQS
jgi:hypothetical protein